MSKTHTKEKLSLAERVDEAKEASPPHPSFVHPLPEGARGLDAIRNAVNLGISEDLARELIYRNSANAEALLSLRS